MISISSLAVGIAVFILFLQIFRAPFSMDTFHRNAERIFTVVVVFPGGSQGDRHRAHTPAALPAALRSEIPEIEDATRIFGLKTCVVRYRDRSFMEGGGLAVDPNVLSVFSFPVLSGDPKTMLASPNSIVLTRSLAAKVFGDEPAAGKILTLEKQIDLVVSGVLEDSPPQSSISYSYLVPLEVADSLHYLKNDWNSFEVSTFVLLQAGCLPSSLGSKLSAFTTNHFSQAASSPSGIYLYPLRDMFFRPENLEAINDRDSRAGYYISLAIGLLFLVVVSVNYMNLVTAKYSDRLKEVGVRKSIGASRSDLVW
ncbi:MAG: ABC transporter permease [Acidobacteriota bacterium]